MSEGFQVAILTSAIGFLVTLITFGLGWMRDQRIKAAARRQEVQSLAALLAAELDHAKGLVRAFRRTSDLLSSGQATAHAAAFNFSRSFPGCLRQTRGT